MGDGVLCEDEEIKEGDEVGHDETRPRVLEVVAKTGIYFHPAEAPQSLKHLGEQQRAERVSLSQILLQSHQHDQITEKTPPRFRLDS